MDLKILGLFLVLLLSCSVSSGPLPIPEGENEAGASEVLPKEGETVLDDVDGNTFVIEDDEDETENEIETHPSAGHHVVHHHHSGPVVGSSSGSSGAGGEGNSSSWSGGAYGGWSSSSSSGGQNGTSSGGGEGLGAFSTSGRAHDQSASGGGQNTGGGQINSGGGQSWSGGGQSWSGGGQSSSGWDQSGSGGGQSSSGGGQSSSGSGGGAGGQGGAEAESLEGNGEEASLEDTIIEAAFALLDSHAPTAIVLAIVILVLMTVCGMSGKIISMLKKTQGAQLAHITEQFTKMLKEGQSSEQGKGGDGGEAVQEAKNVAETQSAPPKAKEPPQGFMNKVKSAMPWNKSKTDSSGPDVEANKEKGLLDKFRKKPGTNANPLVEEVEAEAINYGAPPKGIPKYLRNPDEIRTGLRAGQPLENLTHMADQQMDELQSIPLKQIPSATEQLKRELEAKSARIDDLLQSPESVEKLQTLVQQPDQLNKVGEIMQKPEELKKLGAILNKPEEMKTVGGLVQRPKELKQLEGLMDRPEELARLERLLEAPEPAQGSDGSIGRARDRVSDLETLPGKSPQGGISGPDEDNEKSSAVDRLDRILEKFDELDKLEAFSRPESLSGISRPKEIDSLDDLGDDPADPAQLTAAAKTLSKLPGGVKPALPGVRAAPKAVGSAISKLAAPATRKLAGGAGATAAASKLARPGTAGRAQRDSPARSVQDEDVYGNGVQAQAKRVQFNSDLDEEDYS